MRVVDIQLAGNSHAPAPTDESVEHILIRRGGEGFLEFPLRHLPAPGQELLGRVIRLDQMAHDQLGMRGRPPVLPGLRRGSSEPSANGSQPEALEAWRPPDRPTPEYAAVQSILAQAVQALYTGLETLARSHADAAERIVGRYANARNRLRYLLGVGFGVAAAAAAGLVVFSADLLPGVIGSSLGERIVVFGALGTLVSVLTRLRSLDFGEQFNRRLVVASGVSRPLVGVVAAVVAYLVLRTGIVQVTVGSGANTSDGVYLVAAFLSGFAERLGDDLISSGSATRRDRAAADAEI